MKEFELKYGCNPNQKPAKIFMRDGSDLVCLHFGDLRVGQDATDGRVCSEGGFSRVFQNKTARVDEFSV